VAMSIELQKEGGHACSSNADGARPIWRSVWKLPIPQKRTNFLYGEW
jgi:hypothetical protein